MTPASLLASRNRCVSASSRVAMHREPKAVLANQRRAIRAKIRFWRAPMRREAGGHENFFIAKTRDSESAQRAFNRHCRVVMTSIERQSLNVKITKTAAAQAFPSILTFACVAFSHATCGILRMHRGVVDEHALRAFIHARQHFLKRDAVFLSVLVYSGCSAFRFPSARSD